MKLWKSKSFTARFVLVRSLPALALFALSFLCPSVEIYAATALTLTVSLVLILWDARALPLVLAVALLAQNAPAQEARPKGAGGVCVIVIVIVINGYAYFRLVKACQHLKPRILPGDEPETNAPPKSATSLDIALWQPAPEYCPCDDGKSMEQSAAVNITVENDKLVIQPAQTAATFDSDLVTEGFNPDQPGAQFSHNHARTQTSPISFTESGVSIAGSNQREIVLQRSDDLRSWQEFARLTAPSGMGLQFTDATLGSTARFYRISK